MSTELQKLSSHFLGIYSVVCSWQSLTFKYHCEVKRRGVQSVQCVSFSVLGELHLRTNFAECREIEGLRLRDSNNYRFGKKEKKTNKFGQIYK